MLTARQYTIEMKELVRVTDREADAVVLNAEFYPQLANIMLESVAANQVIAELLTGDAFCHGRIDVSGDS
jgi:hypothetical protein